MCQIGDIIIVNQYKDGNNIISKHSFVVIDDENGTIQGLSYDFVANALSSFKDNKQRKRKLSYSGNFAITSNDTVTTPHNNKDGYIKADQLYYFAKDKISYRVIGQIKEDVFNDLMDFIENSEFELFDIVDNL